MNNRLQRCWLQAKKHINLKNIFLFITPLSVAILIVVLLEFSQTVEHLSHSLIDRTAKETMREMNEFFRPVEKNLRIARHWGISGQIDRRNTEALNAQFIPMMQNNKQISSLIIADTRGEEYMLMREPETWLNRRVSAQAGSLCTHRLRWHYNSLMQGQLDSQWVETKQYDPRLRPWFLAGQAAPSDTSIAWTKPYIFFTSKEPGITASMRWKRETEDSCVVAFDLLFADLSAFTASIHATANGKVFIITDDDRMLGLPADARFANSDSLKQYVLCNYKDLHVQQLNHSIEDWKKAGKLDKPFVYRVDGKKWWAGFRPVAIGPNNVFYVGVILPEDDFMNEVNRTRIVMMCGFGLVVILTLLVISGYSQKHKAMKLLERRNAEILEKNEEIEAQRDEIQLQRDKIEHQSKEITSSIRYAKRIQSAVLPPIELIGKEFGENFVLNRPRDIVSGDFYWMYANAQYKMWAAADCTGHGVPGAFMSFIGYKALDQAVREFGLMMPNDILDKLCIILAETFRQTSKQETSDTIKDGMDISLCVYEPASRVLYFAAAHNPLYILRTQGPALLCNGEAQEAVHAAGSSLLYEIKGDKQPIGLYVHSKAFALNKIDLIPGDVLYTFSDGFADQFGGPKKKKFMYRPFKELLASICCQPMPEQGQLLDQAFLAWMGEGEQIDDVLVFGVRITV